MRLEEIRIQNYRSIDDVTLRFPPNKPVILFGPNNAGKSNILSAILNLRRFSPEYACETKWRPLANGASVYDTSTSNGMLMMQHHLDPLTAKFTNSGAPSRGCDSATEIMLSIDLGDRKERLVVGFSECGSDYLPYVKNEEVLPRLPLPEDKNIPFIRVLESGSGDPSYYLNYLKATRGEEGNYCPEWFLKLIPEIDKRVSDSLKEINVFDELPQGEGRDLPASIFFAGSGQQAWVGRLGELVEASVIKSAVGDLQLVIIDEPETHLHPNIEAQLWEEIQKASKDGVQVILTTHSEDFLCTDDLEGFARVYKERDKTRVRQLTKEELFYTCHPASDNSDKEKSPVGEYWQVRLNSDQLKGFFADVILLVEGATEYYALPIYLSRRFLSKYGIQVVPCGGKPAILTYWRLFVAYGYKCFILYDYDDQGDDWNKKLEKCFHGEREIGECYSISETAAYFLNNWEDYFEFGIDEEKYKEIKSRIKKNYEIKFPSKKQDKKEKDDSDSKELCAKLIALEMVEEKLNIPFIEALKSNLRKLASMSQEEYAKYVETVKERPKSE